MSAASGSVMTGCRILVVTARRRNGRIGLRLVALPQTGQRTEQSIVGRVQRSDLLSLRLDHPLFVRQRERHLELFAAQVFFHCYQSVQTESVQAISFELIAMCVCCFGTNLEIMLRIFVSPLLRGRPIKLDSSGESPRINSTSPIWLRSPSSDVCRR